jgi:uncharacterized membrane protein YphA (DoxX/SURF4 family)
MKIAAIVVRTLLGLLFLFASVVVLFNLVPQPELTGRVKIFNDGLAASGYLVTLLKVTELLCSLALLSGRFVPLALVVLAPIIVNILFFHSFLAPEGLPVAIFAFLSAIFLAWAYRKSYAPLFVAKAPMLS